MPGTAAAARSGAPGRSLSGGLVRVQDVESPLALYRRYRPETFAEVIGQDHVTEPLRAALAQQPGQPRLPLLRAARLRQDHLAPASWPARSTASRRPIADPCGECDSCRDLARGGPGSIDVIEIDAASPRRRRRRPRPARAGVLRPGARAATRSTSSTRPTWSPRRASTPCSSWSRSRRSTCKFIFATTEPEKVIADHPLAHPPLPVPADPAAHARPTTSPSCASRRASRSSPAALPLVVRAGAGSARDTLSVLDQLLGGAGADGRHLRRWPPGCSASPRTRCSTRSSTPSPPATAAAVFGVVDKVIETGQDPRRFTEDLLRRLRDLRHRRRRARRPGDRADRRPRRTRASGWSPRRPGSAGPS